MPANFSPVRQGAFPELPVQVESAEDAPTKIAETHGIPMRVETPMQSEVEILKPILNEDDTDRVRSIQYRLDLAEERLLEGKISEDLYRELKARYENELWEITDGALGKPAK